jgi:catechol 2,3-dioxygenase-like lactoylglutathione lyase family enzyme
MTAPSPLIKIEDISHVRFQAPDLDQMRLFLDQFGLKTDLGADGKLYGRGAGSAPFLHVTELGAPGFLAIGFRAASIGDLEKLARAESVPVEDLAAPGGGKIVRLRDPDGTFVEIVAGQALTPPLAAHAEPLRNSAVSRPRQDAPLRITPGPSNVQRLGHCVLEVTDFRAAEAWYKSRFGFITSDEIEAAPDFAIGAFMRCDRGATPTDHHTLFLLQSPQAPKFNHAAFEVAHLDDLMRGHAHLKHAARDHAWGIGRHILGSQVFDYWKDPFGHELEHWTDGDLFTAQTPPSKAGLADLLNVQWGPPHALLAQMGN